MTWRGCTRRRPGDRRRNRRNESAGSHARTRRTAGIREMPSPRSAAAVFRRHRAHDPHEVVEDCRLGATRFVLRAREAERRPPRGGASPQFSPARQRVMARTLPALDRLISGTWSPRSWGTEDSAMAPPGPGLEGGEIAGGREAAGGVVVPVGVLLVRRVLGRVESPLRWNPRNRSPRRSGPHRSVGVGTSASVRFASEGWP